MKKKIGICLTLLCVLAIGVGGYFLSKNRAVDGDTTNIANNNAVSEEAGERRHEFIDAKTDGYNSLEEMEDASECIVRVKKESEEVIDPSQSGESGRTMSQVKIQEVFHNALGDAIQKDQVIAIWENEFPDGDIICHLAGYEKMEVGKEYILFLRKSTTHDCFLTLGLTYGKVPIEAEESEFMKQNADRIDPTIKTIAAEARKKYVK